MSEGTDGDFKPTKQQLRARTAEKRHRPVRSTRTRKDYKEVTVIKDSEDESSHGHSQTQSERSVGVSVVWE